jgi:hypothetical protein
MLSAIASTPPANWRKRNLAPPAAPRPSRAPQFVKRKNRRRRPPAAAPPSRIERVGLARAYEQRVRLTRGISADRSVPPSPRPIRGVTETTSSQWPPSWNDTDVAGWRRVSCWWTLLRRGPSSPAHTGAGTRHRSAAPPDRPIAINTIDVGAAPPQHRTAGWRRSRTRRSSSQAISPWLALRSASDPSRPVSAVVEPGCC